jgi:hypothetical protein
LRNTKLKAFIFGLLFVLSSSLLAEDVMFSCSENNEINLAFINGVNVDIVSASTDAHALSVRASSLTSDKKTKIKTHLFYNQTNGFLEDIIEAAIQIEREESIAFYSKGINYYIKNLILKKPSFKEWYFDEITKNLDSNTEQMINFFSSTIESTKKPILIVSHSQGNLFANAIFSDADRRSKGGVIHVAPPSGKHYGPVIGHIFDINRVAFLTMPFQNIADFDIGEVSYLFHYFSEVYLNGSMKSVLDEALLRQIDIVKNIDIENTNNKNKKEVSFSLAWKELRDLDLQVQEPNNAHVYHWNKQGKIGTLSNDIKNGGAETYIMQCSKLSEGLTLGIGTNTTLLNSKDFGSIAAPAKLTLNFAGKKQEIDWIPGWMPSFLVKSSMNITFNKDKEVENQWIAHITAQGINSLSFQIQSIKDRLKNLWN